MNIADVYSLGTMAEAYRKLQMPLGKSRGSRVPITTLAGPEVLDDSLLMNWLATNYFFAVGFDNNGGLIMGEIGGTIPKHPGDNKLVLAVSDASMGKVMYGIQQVQQARETGDTRLISELEQAIETPLESRGNTTVINGNRNVAHYDFTTTVARTDVVELLSVDAYLLLSATGVNVMSNKQLKNEQYLFNIPMNESIFERMRNLTHNDPDERLALLKSMKEELLPAQFIAGFHIKYSGNTVTIRPLIAKRDSTTSLGGSGFTTVPSEISYLGTSDPYGRLSGLMKQML